MKRIELKVKKLQEQFPLIHGIEARKTENGSDCIFLGDVAEGGMISDETDQKMAADPEYAGLGFGEGVPAADYYGEFRGGYPWIHPDLEKAVEEIGFQIEWYDPGTLFAYPK